MRVQSFILLAIVFLISSLHLGFAVESQDNELEEDASAGIEKREEHTEEKLEEHRKEEKRSVRKEIKTEEETKPELENESKQELQGNSLQKSNVISSTNERNGLKRKQSYSEEEIRSMNQKKKSKTSAARKSILMQHTNYSGTGNDATTNKKKKLTWMSPIHEKRIIFINPEKEKEEKLVVIDTGFTAKVKNCVCRVCRAIKNIFTSHEEEPFQSKSDIALFENSRKNENINERNSYSTRDNKRKKVFSQKEVVSESPYISTSSSYVNKEAQEEHMRKTLYQERDFSRTEEIEESWNEVPQENIPELFHTKKETYKINKSSTYITLLTDVKKENLSKICTRDGGILQDGCLGFRSQKLNTYSEFVEYFLGNNKAFLLFLQNNMWAVLPVSLIDCPFG